MDLNVNILKTESLNAGSDRQNVELEHNIEIKGSRSFKYLGSVLMKSGKCNEEVLNRTGQARKAASTK
jgi:hypothetical protein